MRCGILGPLEVVDADEPIELRGRRRRALAAYLLAHHGRPVSLDRIVDDLWAGEPSSGAAATVQTYLSQFRRTLAPAAISKRGTGYVLQLPDDDVLDAARFEHLAGAVTAELDPAARVALATEALELWRDVPLAEFAGAAWADRAATRLMTTRLSLLERYGDGLLALGRHVEAIPVLESVVAEHPLDERFWAQLVVAYYRAARHADAIGALARVRRVLGSELGIEPGPELRALEQRVLEHDPRLAAPRSGEATAEPLSSSGVVTFMLTDLVGSTELWDTQPAEMAAAVARHELLVREAVNAADGHVVKSRGEGDSTLSTFDRASDGVGAAVALVEAVRRELWPVDPPLHVRVAVHSGEAERRDGDYFGSTLNRAARLRALAGPDEVLCSRVTAELVADALPAGVAIEERGIQALRGLRRPEVVFAVRSDTSRGHEPAPGPVLFEVLGGVSVVGTPIDSPQLRLLLARLLVDRNRAVPESELVRALWGDAPPVTARNSLQSKISRLRAYVGADRIERDADGYRISLIADELDSDRFERLVARAYSTPSAPDALAMLDEALRLWSDAAYGELRENPFVHAEAARLEALRRGAEDHRLELVVKLGTPEEALSEIEKLLARDPFRESARAVQLRSLATAGRRVEALRVFQDYRKRLAEETGLTPSAPLMDLERALIDGDTPTEPSASDVTAARPPHPHAGEDAATAGIPWRGPMNVNRQIAGRERELRVLYQAIASAARGDPRLVVLTGEAGIGKTRLLDEVAKHAADRGFLVLRGSAVASRAGALGAFRAAITEIAPGLSDDVSIPDDGRPADPATANRLWLGRALQFADALSARARSVPVLLTVDDLQSIDDVSLSALELVHATVADASPTPLHLLVVATHRSIGASELVLARVGRLARSPHSLEIRLTGLDEPALVQLVLDASTLAPTPALVDALSEASGNPLITFARLQSLADARALVVRDGSLDLLGAVSTPVPYDLQEIVTSLLRDVDAETRSDFTRLALLGDGLPLDTLRAATGWSEEHTAGVLARGEREGLVRVHADHFVFVHDLLRWSLAQAVPGMSRRHLHRELATKLEPGTRTDDAPRVALLAEQLRLAGDHHPTSRVGYWSELAGDQCLARALWSEAIRNYDTAADAVDTDDERRAELRVKAGVACFHYHDVARARARLLPAIRELEARGRLAQIGTAGLALHRAAFTLTDDAELVEQARGALVHFIEASDGHADLVAPRARALAQLAEATFGTRDNAENERLVDAARRCASGTEDDDVHTLVEFAAGLTELSRLHLNAALTSFHRSVHHAERGRDPWFEAAGLGRIAFATILSGGFHRARPAVEQARELQHSLRLWSELSLTEALNGTIELLVGDAESAAVSAQDALRYYERSGYRFTPGVAFPNLAAAQLALGDDRGALHTIQRWRNSTHRGHGLFEILLLALTDDRAAAVQRLSSRPLRVVPPDAVDLLGLPGVAAVAGIALALSMHDVLSGLLPVVDGLVERGVLVVHGWPTFLPELGAEIARALDEPDADRRAAFAHDAARQFGLE